MNTVFKITHLKLVNHIVLGDVDINFDNTMISIMGKNGSGKSFLMDTLQPYARSTRFISSYPVKKGEVGYKQVDFQLPDGTIYETIHEYMPKGNTHSCKSYLNKISGDTKMELNPTGHCEKYDELIRKHLNSDPAILNIGFISFKANGITGSKGVERKKVLESTIDSNILKTYKKNVKQLVSEYNAYYKQCEHKKIRLASLYTESSLEREIASCKNKKLELEMELSSKQTELQTLMVERDRLEKLKLIDRTKLKTIYDIAVKLKGIDFEGNINSRYHELSDVSKRLQIDSNRIVSLNDKIIQINRSNSLKSNITALEKQLNDVNKNIIDQENNLNDYVCNWRENKIEEWLSKLIYYSNEFSKRLTNIKIVVSTESAFNTILNELIEDKVQIDKFIARYELASSNSDGEKYDIIHYDVCDKCKLYDKFVLSEKFIEDNRDRYKKEIEFNIPERLEKINNLTLLKDNVLQSVKNLILDIPTYLTEKSVKTLDIKDVDTFLYACSNNKLTMKLNNLYDWIKDKKSIIESNKTEIDNISNKINWMKDTLSTCEINETNIEKYELEVSELMDKVRKMDNEISNPISKLILELDMTDSFNMEYVLKDVDEVITIYDNIANNDNKLQEVISRCEDINKSIKLLPFEIDNTFAKMIDYNHKLDELKDVNSRVVDLDRKRKMFQRCKDIIEKDIPLVLLRNNLKFIEETTNNMLTINNINMSVNIIPTDSEIIIEVNVNDKTIDDAVQLSAGETSIISLLLNACILHILGYPILCLDEADSFMDTINRVKYVDLLGCIQSMLNINQVILISHHITGTNIDYATKICIGELPDVQDVDIQI